MSSLEVSLQVKHFFMSWKTDTLVIPQLTRAGLLKVVVHRQRLICDPESTASESDHQKLMEQLAIATWAMSDHTPSNLLLW